MPLRPNSQAISYANSRLAFPALLALPLLFLFGIYLLLNEGFSIRFFLFTLGSVLSFFGLRTYSLAMQHERQRSWALLLFVRLGWFPYLFGCYVTFYEGLWRLRLLLNGFSIGTLLASVVFVVLGYMVVLGIYRVSELGQRLDEVS